MSKSSYYYKPVDRSDKQKSDQELVKKIESVVLEFSGYGYRRVTKHLQRLGIRVNHKRVLRLMREHGLTKKRKRRFINTTNSNHGYLVYPNLVRDIAVTAINQVWVSDITYIRLLYDFAYLAAIMDLCSRKVIGYSISDHINSSLALTALDMAIRDRQPPPGCIHHSDRGVQYACNDYIGTLKQFGFVISMSRPGNPYDNAYAESFFKTLKYEEVYLSDYRTLADARISLESFIEDVYNTKRLHSGIGYLPPEEFERSMRGITDNRQNILTQMS
jgi:transposase InsO family protein